MFRIIGFLIAIAIVVQLGVRRLKVSGIKPEPEQELLMREVSRYLWHDLQHSIEISRYSLLGPNDHYQDIAGVCDEVRVWIEQTSGNGKDREYHGVLDNIKSLFQVKPLIETRQPSFLQQQLTRSLTRAQHQQRMELHVLLEAMAAREVWFPEEIERMQTMYRDWPTTFPEVRIRDAGSGKVSCNVALRTFRPVPAQILVNEVLLSNQSPAVIDILSFRDGDNPVCLEIVEPGIHVQSWKKEIRP